MNRIIKDVLSIKSVQRTLNIFALLSILVMAAPLANLTASAAQANNNNNAACFHHNNANGSVILKNGHAVGTFRVPNSCKSRQQVSLAVYKINDGIWQHRLNNQYLYASKTHWYGPGVHTISVPVPNCAWQADLIKGMPANLAANGGTQKHGLAAKVGGNKVPCKPAPAPKPTPKPTPKPPAPKPVTPVAPVNTVTNTNTNNNVNTVNVETGSTTSETPASETEVVATETVSSKDGTPTELANTGPGGVIAAFVGFSSLGSLAYRMFIGRRLGTDL